MLTKDQRICTKLTNKSVWLLLLAFVMSSELWAQNTQPSSDHGKMTYTMTQLKSPISRFLAPNADTINYSTKKLLYDDMSYLYVQKFAQLRPEKAAYQSRVADFFLPTQKNEFNPDGRDVFFSNLDYQLKKDRTVIALEVMIETGDAFIEVVERNK